MTDSASAVTRALLAPPMVTLEEAAWRRVGEHLRAGVARALDGLPRGPRVDVTLRSVRLAGSCPSAVGIPEPPFVWKPVLARRSLGLAAVRACAAGRYRGPAEAVGPVAEAAVEEWRRTGWRTYFWEPWFAGLGPGARAVVLAEGVGWATSLWAGLDWGLLHGRAELGRADESWTCQGSRAVRCKARTELRVASDRARRAHGPQRASAGTALVSLSAGCPGAGWQEELAYVALVGGLGSSTHPIATRVLGLWPDAGIQRVVEVDEALLHAAAGRVVATVAAVAASQRVTATAC